MESERTGMDVTYLTEQDALKRAQDYAKKIGGGAALAREIGVSPQYISAVLRGQKPLNAPILARIGLETETLYRPVNRKD